MASINEIKKVILDVAGNPESGVVAEYAEKWAIANLFTLRWRNETFLLNFFPRCIKTFGTNQPLHPSTAKPHTTPTPEMPMGMVWFKTALLSRGQQKRLV